MAEKTNLNMLFANFNQDFSYVHTVCRGRWLNILNIPGVYLLGRGKGIASRIVIHLAGYTRWVCVVCIRLEIV